MNSESPSPIRDEGWMGPGGRKFVAVGILLIVLGAGTYYVIGGAEEIGEFLEEISQEPEGEERAVTLEDTTIEEDQFPPPEPGSSEAVDQQLERAQRQLECIQRAPNAGAMARCIQPP